MTTARDPPVRSTDRRDSEVVRVHLRTIQMTGQRLPHGDQSLASWKPSSRAMLDSGASQILAPWRRPRARLIEATE